MKRSTSILIIVLSCLFSPACNNDKKDRADEKKVISVSEVPDAVKNSFTAKYSTATDVIWENAHEDDIATYKVKFRNNNQDMKAEFKKDGSLIKENLDE